MRRLGALFLCLLCGACAAVKAAPQDYLAQKNVTPPTLETFDHCSHYGCQRVQAVALEPGDWRAIKKAYGGKARNAEAERAKIAKAVGAFEEIAGGKTGTAIDKGGTFLKMGNGQLDCVDESVNTTSYLLLLQERGWLEFHEVSNVNARFPLVHSGRWPHQSATMREIDTNAQWAVDSWLHDNGAPPEIVPLRAWLDGHRPPDNADEKAG